MVFSWGWQIYTTLRSWHSWDKGPLHSQRSHSWGSAESSLIRTVLRPSFILISCMLTRGANQLSLRISTCPLASSLGDPNSPCRGNNAISQLPGINLCTTSFQTKDSLNMLWIVLPRDKAQLTCALKIVFCKDAHACKWIPKYSKADYINK